VVVHTPCNILAVYLDRTERSSAWRVALPLLVAVDIALAEGTQSAGCGDIKRLRVPGHKAQRAAVLSLGVNCITCRKIQAVIM
jgi:hypothetical protein